MPMPDFEVRAVASQSLIAAGAHVLDPHHPMPFEVAENIATGMLAIDAQDPDSDRGLRVLVVVAVAETNAPIEALSTAIQAHLKP